MHIRSSLNLIIESSTIPKRCNRRHSKKIVEPALRTIVETPVATMADIRTMSELLQVPTKDYGDAIVIPAILAETFELKNTLTEYMILSGADNRPPMLEKDLYDSWKSQMELYMQNREYGRMILESVKHGPLIWPTVEENGVIRTKKYVELSAAEKIQAENRNKIFNIHASLGKRLGNDLNFILS
ncbi:hypothetical protein Tco_1474552 [Tanacetum coccineum]